MHPPLIAHIDTVIIGAGVVGLAIAEAISDQDRQVVILEKNNAFGQETSSRNSEVIHAGIYYPKHFLKSRLCVNGNRMLYDWCKRKHVPHRKIGKLILATNADECSELERIKGNAEECGVAGLAFLTRAEVRSLEPGVVAEAALFSRSTGIIDSHRLMRSLLISAEEKGAILSCNAEITDIHFDGVNYDLVINGGEYRARAKTLINSAGLHSDRLAALVGIDIDAQGYRLKYCKGSYFSAVPAPRLNHLVYPVPTKNNVALGIHATLDLSGRIRFGPDSQYLDLRKDDEQLQSDSIMNFDYTVDEDRKEAFYQAVSKYLPDVAPNAFHPDMSGIRPKIQGPGDSPCDFIIKEETSLGFPRLINLIGIESPGLTACFAIGELIKKTWFL